MHGFIQKKETTSLKSNKMQKVETSPKRVMFHLQIKPMCYTADIPSNVAVIFPCEWTAGLITFPLLHLSMTWKAKISRTSDSRCLLQSAYFFCR
jgi:hypothetical protein